MTRSIIIIGAGGHAKVVLDILRDAKMDILGFVDPKYARGSVWRHDLECLGEDERIAQHYDSSWITLANGIGGISGERTRSNIYLRYRDAGFLFETLVHRSAVIAEDVELTKGAQVMAGAIIQAGTRIGENVIVNTGAVVDHDCMIGDHAHVAPGAVLSGGVNVGHFAHIGTGASVIQGITIGENAVIGAGAIVTKSVEKDHIIYPARSTKSRLAR